MANVDFFAKFTAVGVHALPSALVHFLCRVIDVLETLLPFTAETESVAAF
jgi:hypothetical protein